MSGWKRILTEIVADAEAEFDRLKYRLAYALGGPDPIKIVTYRGFGTPSRLHVQGRVLEDQGVRSPRDDDSIWHNLLYMYRRLSSDEVPHARLRARLGGLEQEIQADEEGQFAAWLEPRPPLERQGEWQEVELELLGPRSTRQEGAVRARAEVLVPEPAARFGVISDIDDTVLKTDATSLVRMARTVFLGNARTRLPFPGAAAFYRALRRGAPGGAPNPLFYVSNSPWNLYDLLAEFLRLQEFPHGPVLFLRNWGIDREALSPADKTAQRAHKLRAIRLIMDTYPDLPFILVGDSGEQDPEIYREVCAVYGERVLAVYVRNVEHDPRRPESIRELAKEVVSHGSTLLLAETSLGMAEHAAERGWIDPAALPEIGREKRQDEQEPGKLERLLGEEIQAEGPVVTVPGRDPEETRRAIDAGAIEEALHQGDPRHERAPDVRVEPDDRPPPPSQEKLQLATLGGGCFWCLEAVFERLRGVVRVRSGYAGGETPRPTYREVCGGRTGHAEVVQITFDPNLIGYEQLLEVFFATHDPTTPDRQGADVGTQYRSLILTHDEEQGRTAARIIARLEAERAFPNPIVTEVAPLTAFHEAEPEHQEYYRRHRDQSYCRIVIEPKLKKLERDHGDRVKK